MAVFNGIYFGGLSLSIHKLTKRQLEVLSLIAKGLSNKEIALYLKLKVSTINSHVVQILHRLEVLCLLTVTVPNKPKLNLNEPRNER